MVLNGLILSLNSVLCEQERSFPQRLKEGCIYVHYPKPVIRYVYIGDMKVMCRALLASSKQLKIKHGHMYVLYEPNAPDR